MSGERLGLFVAGVQKCGTSSLFAQLARHPQLAPPAIKETHFFDNEATGWLRDARAPSYAALHRLFPPADHRLRFEATPISIFWPPALARIHAYNPAAKLILIYRDPVERAWSHWRMEVARGAEDLSFAAAIREGRRRLPADARTDPAWRVHSYVERGRYAAQLARARALFGTGRILTLRLEDLVAQPAATMAQVTAFLGVAPARDVVRLHVNAGGAGPGRALPSPADAALIRAELAEDSARFAAMTGIGWPEHVAA